MGANKKYKAHISKYVRHILKYLRHIFRHLKTRRETAPKMRTKKAATGRCSACTLIYLPAFGPFPAGEDEKTCVFVCRCASLSLLL